MLCCHSNGPATDLAEQLCALLPGDFAKKAWFGTSGSDANDCVARLLPLATGRRRLVSFVGGYHGTTSGSAALSGHQAQASVIGGGNVTKVPYPIRTLPARPLQPRGLLAEVPRARGAVRARRDLAGGRHRGDHRRGRAVGRRRGRAARELPPALRELCDRHGIWLVFDEVKIGLGRTGSMFAFEHSGVVADAVTLGKPLGGGLPLSAVVGRRELLDVETFSLFTLGGAPMPMRAGSQRCA